MSAAARQGLAIFLILVLLPACRLAAQPLPTPLAAAATSAPPTASPSPSTPPTAVPSPTTLPPTPTPSPSTATPSPTPPHTSPWLDIRPHYTITAALDTEAHNIHVQQTIAITNTAAAPWSELVLHMAPAYWPDLFTLHSLHLTADGDATPLQPSWDHTMMRITLPQPLSPAQSLRLQLQYSLALPRLDPNGWGPTGNAGWSPDLTQVGDWYPALVPYHRQDGWQSWTYWPVGDPVRSVISDFDVTIHAPPDHVLVAAGHQDTNDGSHHFRLRRARAFAFLASPHYVRHEVESGGIPIRVFVLSRHAGSAPVVSAAAAQSIALFSRTYGPYPYQELIIAENGFLTAMEYPALVSLSGYAFTAYEGSPDSLLVSITAHEVAHQWWYAAVGSDQVHEPWLDEALAMYSELIFYEHHYPDLVDWWWQYRVDRWQPTGSVDASPTAYPDSASFVHDMYGTAAHFMSDLRDTMGPAALHTFLQAYYAKHGYGWATGDDFFSLAVTFSSAEQIRALTAVYFAKMPQPLAP